MSATKMDGATSSGARRATRLAALVVAAAFLLPPGVLAAGLGRGSRVAATIAPLADIVRQVSGDAVEVVRIVPPGASPHTSEPTPAVVRSLSGARAIFFIGHRLDDWVLPLARAAGGAPTIRADSGIPLLRSERGDVDPHYWLSCTNARIIASAVERRLEALFPERAADFRRRLSDFSARLDAADAEIRRTLEGLPGRDIATFHDGFRYFTAAYGLRVVAVFEPYPGREPGPRFVEEFERKIRDARVRVIFSEPQLSVDVLSPIARDLHVKLSVLDPLGGVPGRETFLDLMRFNARQIARAAGPGD
jgi:ABC-type Zn uptake system ZnuABC Zn-binding protein ZnuA